MPQTQIVNIQIKLKYMGCIFKAAHIKNSILSHLASNYGFYCDIIQNFTS